MKIVDIKQGSSDWLNLRKKHIGASDAPVLMEVSPWKTPYQLWREKLGLSENVQNKFMKEGLNLEPIARQKFIEEVGHKVFPLVALHDNYEFMLASFDGVSEDKNIVVEIKCPGPVDHEMAMDGVIPEKYIPQVMHQMEVSGVQSMFYFSYSEKSHKILEIERDNNYIKNIIHKEKEFWDCVENLEAPDLTEKDYVRRNDKEWLQLSKEWIEICNLEKRKEQIRNRLIELSESKNTIGGGIKLSKIPRKGNVDYKSIPELNNVDFDKYRKGTIETYRIGVY